MFGHETEEVADAGAGFQDVGRALKAQVFQALIYALYDRLGGVVGILGGAAGLTVFLKGQELPQFGGFRFPGCIFRIEDLGEAAPADITHQGLLIFRGGERGAAFPEPLEGGEGLDIVPEFGLGPALAQPVVISDDVGGGGGNRDWFYRVRLMFTSCIARIS